MTASFAEAQLFRDSFQEVKLTKHLENLKDANNHRKKMMCTFLNLNEAYCVANW